jgi:oxazoline/thiazoline synthase
MGWAMTDSSTAAAPRLRADYEPVRVAGEAGAYAVLVGELRSLLVEDPVVADVVGLLDGTRAVAEVAAALRGRHSLVAVLGAVHRLRRLGVLAAGPGLGSVGLSAAWDAREVPPAAAEDWFRTGSVTLLDLGAPSVGDLAGALRALGLDVAVESTVDKACHRPAPSPPDPTRNGAPMRDEPRSPGASTVDTAELVVAAASMTDPRLAAVNAARLGSGRPWTLVRPYGRVLLLGPHLVPGVTGCWECLRQRWTDNEQVAGFLDWVLPGRQHGPVARAALPATAVALAGLLAAELPVLALRGASPRITGAMTAFDTLEHTASTHRLVRQPQCPACGDPALMTGAAPRLRLRPRPVLAGADAGWRSEPAADTYDRLAHHVSSYLGVVTRLVPLGPADGVTHTFAAGHNFALARSPQLLRRNLRGQSGGKGRTEAQAKVSAIGEAVERYAAVWRGDRPTRRAAYVDLAGAVRLRELLLFSDRQYAERDRLNPGLGHFHQVPRPLADDEQLDWTTGWSLTDDEPRALPAAYCWYDHPDIRRLGVCAADSNGSAAGTGLEEAILQGFCELVERDAVALWWYHRSRVPGVDLDSFADPWLAALRAHYAGPLRRRLWALDLTTDLGIPAYAAVSAAADRPGEDVIVGFGAHLDPAVALTRALTELNQFLPAVTGRHPDGSTRYAVADPDTLAWLTTVGTAEESWLCPDPGRPATTAARPGIAPTGDLAQDVRGCVRIAAAAGLEVIVVDQSRPDIELAVCKVVVPGLRHFWRRLGPGRLWTVPPRLGRTPLAAGEPEANPRSVFF